VKIDRSFPQGVGTNDRSLNLLRRLARLSADLGMAVAVEGIETEEQLALVAQATRVEEKQGYLMGTPIPGGDIIDMLFTPPAPGARLPGQDCVSGERGEARRLSWR
jgi:EAL domain-containing protein (putative c-di-GMP-specific phosphodiesterase class I)